MWTAFLVLIAPILIAAAHLTSAHIAGGLVVPLHHRLGYNARLGSTQRRLLSKNATIPLQGAVRDYGYVTHDSSNVQVITGLQMKYARLGHERHHLHTIDVDARQGVVQSQARPESLCFAV